LDLIIFKVERINTHGGSIRVYICQDQNISIDNSVNELLVEEEAFGLKKLTTYINFGKKIQNLKKNVINNLHKLKKKHKNIIGYGAPAKATTALNFFNIREEIDFIVEDNKLKHEKYMPGVNIPIISKNKLELQNPMVLVLAWNFFNEIKKNNKDLAEKFVNIKSLEKNYL
jgi:hypothetical protein